jgi:hypothetical protein
VLKIAQHLLTVSPRLFSIWFALQLAIQGVLGGVEAPKSARFIGGLLAVYARWETIWVVVGNRGILCRSRKAA